MYVSPANFGIVYEGVLDEKRQQASITSRLFHHGELSPVNMLSAHPESYDEKYATAELIDTCQRINEIVATMVRFRLHGRKESEKSLPIEINWVYQLLSNQLVEKIGKARAYAILRQAISLMDGMRFEIPQQDKTNLPIVLHLKLFSAGISPLNGDPGIMTEERDGENCKAYIQLTSALNDAIADMPESEKDAANFNAFKKLLMPASDVAELVAMYEKLQHQLKMTAGEFHRALAVYSEDTAAKNADPQVQERKRNAHLKLMESRVQADAINESLARVALQIRDGVAKTKTQEAIEGRRQVYARNADQIKIVREKAKQDLKALCEDKTLSAQQLRQKIVAYSALIYKSYMDELYYSVHSVTDDSSILKYSTPLYSQQFHAYMAAYQRLIGMMASAGGKSGNNTTYLLRIALAAMEGRPPLTFPAPLNCHEVIEERDEGIDRLGVLIEDVAKANSAVFNTIADTGGGTPNVSRAYAGFEDIQIVRFLKKFSRYASHLFEFSPEVKAIWWRVAGWGLLGFGLCFAAVLVASGVGAPVGAGLLVGLVAAQVAPYLIAGAVGLAGFILTAVGARIGYSLKAPLPKTTDKPLLLENKPKEKPALSTTAENISVLSKSPSRPLARPSQSNTHELEDVPPPAVRNVKKEEKKLVVTKNPELVEVENIAAEKSSDAVSVAAATSTVSKSPEKEVEVKVTAPVAEEEKMPSDAKSSASSETEATSTVSKSPEKEAEVKVIAPVAEEVKIPSQAKSDESMETKSTSTESKPPVKEAELDKPDNATEEADEDEGLNVLFRM